VDLTGGRETCHRGCAPPLRWLALRSLAGGAPVTVGGQIQRRCVVLGSSLGLVKPGRSAGVGFDLACVLSGALNCGWASAKTVQWHRPLLATTTPPGVVPLVEGVALKTLPLSGLLDSISLSHLALLSSLAWCKHFS
jgi:hypothetical protein